MFVLFCLFACCYFFFELNLSIELGELSALKYAPPRPFRFAVLSRLSALPILAPLPVLPFFPFTDFTILAHLLVLPFYHSYRPPSSFGILPFFARAAFTFCHFTNFTILAHLSVSPLLPCAPIYDTACLDISPFCFCALPVLPL